MASSLSGGSSKRPSTSLTASAPRSLFCTTRRTCTPARGVPERLTLPLTRGVSATRCGSGRQPASSDSSTIPGNALRMTTPCAAGHVNADPDRAFIIPRT